MARKLLLTQLALLREVISVRRPDLLDLLDQPETLPLSVRNELRDAVGDELVEYELVDDGDGVTARGWELEYLIDVLGPTLEGE